MNFDLTDEQAMLRDTTRGLLAQTYGAERGIAIRTAPDWDPAVWKQLAELGLLGLPFPEEDGGMGAGPVETMVVMTEVGHALAVEPFLDTVVIGGGLIADGGSTAQRAHYLPRVAAGTALLAFAHDEPGSRWPHQRVETTATRGADGWVVTGTKNPVLRGDRADTLIVSATLPDGGVGLFLIAAEGTGVTRRSYATCDGLTGAQVEFAAAAAEPLGDGGDASSLITGTQVRALAGLCAEAVGAMTEALRLTTEYLTQRKQFGVPLAKFQTLTQRAADMYVSLELATSMSLYATLSLADGVIDPAIASRAKLQISNAARHIGQEAIQLHGGIGMTAEYPVGHYVSRLTAIGQTLGGSADHLRILANDVGGHDMIAVTP
ncbi:MAG TPA: acyl-CoA dehydrogenase family protein [Mycobacterium sp.]|nr:acyl-CoA dehydrogenase family protein [Mycobacterium sp.]